MKTWHHTTDILVVGSGGGGMTAALMAKDLGNDTLLIEKGAYYGGSTALSGGALWVPNSHLMKRAGIKDSSEEALTYLNRITEEIVSEERLHAYIEKSVEMVKYLEKHTHVCFEVVHGYPDYYPEIEGAKPRGGRTIEPRPFNARHLKHMWKDLYVPPAQELVLGKIMVSAGDVRRLLGASFRTRMKAARLFAAYFLNPLRFLARYDTRLTLGNALIGRLRLSVAERGIPLWLNTPARKILVEKDRVTGLVAEKDGRFIRIQANKGIILAAGGFEKNQVMREKYQTQPVSAEWSMGSPENTGDIIQMGLEIGAGLGIMDDAWWMPTTVIPGNCMPWYAKNSWWQDIALKQGKSLPWFVLVDRSLPGTIIVNSQGRRFVNEAVPYIDFVHAQMVCHGEKHNAVPAFMIADQCYHLKYPMGPVMLAHPTKKFVKNGFLYKSDTLKGLADQCGIDPDGLIDEVKKYNQYAAAGKDLDFNKGESPIDTFYGDTAVRPNPCLAPIRKPPFYAISIYPGDIGTKGGLLTDVNARVLKIDREPIEGLYATGNCTASVMGNTYPGAGGTIGPSMTFGFIAAHHLNTLPARERKRS